MIALAAHGWSVGIDPALGGSLLHARHDGGDILRAARAGCTDPLQAACFPLVPYANRIADGRFAFTGRAYRLPRNFGDHPHSLHGTGWQAAWQVADRTDSTATLRLNHTPNPAWPWRFTAEQRIAIGEEVLTITLTLTNADTTPMPAGVGFHPYFPAHDNTRLTFAAAGVWLSDATQLPTGRVAADHFGDWSSGEGVQRDDLIDHAWDGWDGAATIGDTRIVADAHIVHIYIPPGEDFVCIEPVSHRPDAINRAGMPILSAGDTTSLTMRISAPPDRHSCEISFSDYEPPPPRE